MKPPRHPHDATLPDVIFGWIVKRPLQAVPVILVALSSIPFWIGVVAGGLWAQPRPYET